MKLMIAAFAVLSMSEASLADNAAGRFKIEGGRIIVAQSSCGMCFDGATACRLGCNGAGTCIQACDDKLRDCREQNCGARRSR
jgi:hypothetical protein